MIMVYTYEDFERSILPGNYALTKSMEIMKKNTSGTLWYTKKFLTLYYFVFLNNISMSTNQYIHEVCNIFDNFIDALPEELQSSAMSFFYPDIDAINFKSEAFRTFTEFAPLNNFEDMNERTNYYKSARKLYFATLMNSGGQTGIKKILKNAMLKCNFTYSKINILKNIQEGAVNSIYEKISNNINTDTDRDIKRVVSSTALCAIKEHYKNTGFITLDIIRECIETYPHESPEYNGIENDVHAFIRNERQVLYYFGFFHSKNTGNCDEYSSLTPVGEVALQANYIEFTILWEHQKLKMISQPPTVTISKLPRIINNAQYFALSYTPYTDILAYVSEHGSMSYNEYACIVSRKKECFLDSWQEIQNCARDRLEDLQNLINRFDRTRDKNTADRQKELKKYALGILSNLEKDQDAHFLGICKLSDSCLSISSREKLRLVHETYKALDKYKIARYGTLFASCETEMRKQYMDNDATSVTASKVNPKVKIRWDLYNICIDSVILSVITYIVSRILVNKINVDQTDIEFRELANEMISKCPLITKKVLKCKTISALQSVFKASQCAIEGDFSILSYPIKTISSDDIKNYLSANTQDIFNEIDRVSMANKTLSADRDRNTRLVKLLKLYYYKNFGEGKNLRCECCGKKSFIDDNGMPYIEFHHLIPFGLAAGPDHYLNLFALCPECHRKFHRLNSQERIALYNELSAKNYLSKPFEMRLIELKKAGVLASFHLEYLLAENAITTDIYQNVLVA